MDKLVYRLVKILTKLKKVYENSAPSISTFKKLAAEFKRCHSKMTHVKDGQKLKQYRKLSRIKVCEIAEAVGISEEKVAEHLPRRIRDTKALLVYLEASQPGGIYHNRAAPDLQGWVFGHGLDEDTILGSAKTHIYRYFLGVELRSVQEDLVWRRTLSSPSTIALDIPPSLETKQAFKQKNKEAPSFIRSSQKNN
ncbi:hypothetical protein LAZ67_3001340 [Cordylochernes scorpioides]|uniref:Uncharacterized protein n=1 Tax=Cordylochernes scorpioides TaxID=51811 RepID=A0ABY6KBK5_9ARAC|nr:hypothetical protein LAZ67_3001340 [Cordylochernes scorpioides]